MSDSAWSFNWDVKVYLSSFLILRLCYVVIVKALGIFSPPGEFHLGAIQSNFYAVAGLLFIRLISRASKSKVPGEQFGWNREITGKVFITGDLFLLCCTMGIFSVTQIFIWCIIWGLMAIVASSFTWKQTPHPGRSKLARSLNIFRATF